MGMGVAAMAIAAAVAKIAKGKRMTLPKRDAPLNILVVRPDRLGDVLLSTPVFEALKEALPQAHLTVWVKEFIAPLIEGNPFVDEVVTWSYESVSAVKREIRARRFDCAVVLKTEPKIAMALVAAGVPVRVGPYSKPHSFLLYNLGMRQHRSRVEMHEADYNLQLLERLGIHQESRRKFTTRIGLREDVRRASLHWLQEKGWNSAQGLVAIHPGMGGSALNWPEDHYIELARSLAAEGRTVLITGGAGEGELLSRIKKALGDLAGRVLFYGGPDAKGLEFLAGLFSWANVVVAPSTGPLHVAVALGKPVVTFYPPIRVQSAKRWGPYVQDPGRARVMVPEIACSDVFGCKRSCGKESCMRSLPVEQALKYIREYL